MEKKQQQQQQQQLTIRLKKVIFCKRCVVYQACIYNCATHTVCENATILATNRLE